LTSCSEKKPAGKYPVIDVVGSIGNYQRVYMSDFFSSIELIPLETNKNSLVGGDPLILANDSLLFINSVYSPRPISFRNLLAFNRKGKFLNQIGREGRGPGEYFRLTGVFLNRDRPTIFINATTDVFEYDFTGKVIHSINPYVFDESRFRGFHYFEDNLFVGFLNYENRTGYRHCLLDSNGNIVKCFPNLFYMTDEDPPNSWVRGAMEPFRVYERFYLKDHINDTLYSLTNSNLQPEYVFDLGKYSYPLGKTNEEGKIKIEAVEMNDAEGNYIRTIYIVGTSNHFFYELSTPFFKSGPRSRLQTNGRIFGIYNKTKNTNMLLDTDPVHLQRGLINDINGGLSFFPKYYIGNGEVVDIWSAEDMKELLTEEYFASIKIKDPQAHQKLRELLKTLDEEDNPVVVIAKLKQ